LRSFGLLTCLLLVSCQPKAKQDDLSSSEEEVPTSYITQDKKMGLGNVPDESAYLPYCLDSVDIPRFKKKFCAQRILSQLVLNKHPEWKSIAGVVYIQLTIETDGSISKILMKDDFTGKSVGADVVKTAAEVLDKAQCLPAKRKGFKIKSNLVVPIYFGLDLLDEEVLNNFSR